MTQIPPRQESAWRVVQSPAGKLIKSEQPKPLRVVKLIKSEQPEPLRVVPPQERQQLAKAKTPGALARQSQAAAPGALVPQPKSAPASTRRPLRFWAITGAIAAGAVVVGGIPIPNYVTGEARVEARIDARDRLTMPRAGIVRIQVERNSQVAPGDIVATIDSPELAQQIAEAERGLEQAEGAVQTANQSLVIAQIRWNASQLETQIAQARTRDRQADLQALATGDGLPRSRQIRQQQAALVQEMQGLRDEITGLESEIDAIRSEQTATAGEIEEFNRQLASVQARFDQRQVLVNEGGLPPTHDAIAAVEREKLQLEQQRRLASDRLRTQRHQIPQITAQIRQRRSAISQRQRQIAAADEQVAEVFRQTREELKVRQDERLLTEAQAESVYGEVKAAEAEMRVRMELLAKWKQELGRLQAEQEQLILRAKTNGTVIGDDLDLKDGSRLEAGEEVLSIANLQELRATVQIRQEDYRLVELEQPVKFQAPGHEPYRAEVSARSPRIATETPGAAPMASVEILIDNEANRLLPGGEGYAHIRTGQLRIYEKVQHELGKLFNVGKWMPW